MSQEAIICYLSFACDLLLRLAAPASVFQHPTSFDWFESIGSAQLHLPQVAVKELVFAGGGRGGCNSFGRGNADDVAGT